MNNFEYYQTMRRRKRRIRNTIGVLVAVIVFGLIFGVCINVQKGTERTVTVRVTDKERVCSGGQYGTNCKYLVYTDHGTFKITDAHNPFVFWRTNSSDVYGNIQKNQEYTLRVIGWRFGLSSSYPNIETATPVATSS